MSTTPTVAIFSSGRGSNFEALLQALKNGSLSMKVKTLVSDQKAAQAIQIAEKNKIPVTLAEKAVGETSSVQEEKFLHSIEGCEYLVLAGYMRVLSPKLIEKWRDPSGVSRIVNIHPSLLPAFPGLRSYERAFEAGCKLAGVSVHLVEEKVDQGPILAQEAFSIAKCKTAQEVEAIGLKIEHKLYAETLSWFFNKRYQLFQVKGKSHVRPD